MRKLYGSTSWRRVLALALVFVMMFSIMGTSGYSVFAEELPETGEEVVVSEPEAVTPEVTVDDQGPSPGAEEVTEPVEPAAEDEEPAEAVEEAEEAEEPSEENAEPVEPTEEAIEDEEVEEPAEAAEEAEESEELELVEDEEIVEEEEDPEEEAVSEDSSEPTLVEEASQIVAEDDGSECEDPESVADPSVISDTAQLILDALTQEGEAVLEELSEEELLEEELLEEELLEEPEVFFTDTMTKELERVIVTAIPSEGAFREKVNMSVVPIPDKSRMYLEAEAALAESGVNYDGMLAYDISFRNEAGDFVEPEASVSITMEITDKALAAVNSDNMDVESLMVTHIGSEETAAVADVADETDGSVTVSMNEDVVDGIAAEFVVDSFSTFVLTWTNAEEGSTIHWGITDENGGFQELEEDSTVTMDTTASTLSLRNSISGYQYRDAVYCAPGEPPADGVNIESIIYKTDDGWACDAIYSETGDVTSKAIADGSNIYVYYYVPTTPPGPAPEPGENPTVPSPTTTKTVDKNPDGTYTITLDIAGATVTEDESHYVNVLVILDATQSMSGTKWNNAKAAVNTLIETMTEGNNAANAGKIDFALVTFGRAATVAQNWTKDNAAFKTTCANINMVNTSGTNWEAGVRGGLYGVLNAYPEGETAENHDPTYVIFLTDGDPNTYYWITEDIGTTYRYDRRNYTVAASDVGNPNIYTNDHMRLGYQGSSSTSADRAKDEVRAITGMDARLYGIYCFDGTAADTNSDSYRRLDDVIRGQGQGGQKTIAATADTIESEFQKIAETALKEVGTTSVGVDDGIPSLSSVSSNVVGEAGGYEYYKGTKAEGEDEITWTEWTDAPGAVYSEDNGVTWDLSRYGSVNDGDYFRIKFTVWPSQEAYDTIADLNNGLIRMTDDELDEAGIGYVEDAEGNRAYYLLTNTHLHTFYKYNGTSYSETPSDKDLPKEQMKLPTTTISVAKYWNNEIDGREAMDVELTVTKDGEDYYNVQMGNPISTGTHTWKQTPDHEIYISYGQITKTGSGYEVIEPGHEYTVIEPLNFSYRWDLSADVYRPMLVNGEETILIKTDSPTGTDGTDYYVIGGNAYKVVTGTTENVLVATNNRRSNLAIKKVVTGDDPPDAAFAIQITLDNPNDPHSGDSAYNDWYHTMWFAVQTNPADRTTVVTEGVVVEGATAEDGNTGFYWFDNGGTATVYLKADQWLCIANMAKGTKYTVTELSGEKMPAGFAFVRAEATAENKVDGETSTPATINQNVAEGIIDKPNSDYRVVYTNKYELVDVTFYKEWDDDSDQDGIRPDDLTLTLNGLPKGTTVPNPVIAKNGNHWTYTWSNLPKYVGGEEVTYTVSENAVPEGYVATGSPANPDGTITNSHTPVTTNVSVEKVWSDNNDQDGIRPNDLTLTLNGLPNGTTAPNPTIVKDGNNWTYTWSNLPKYVGGTEVTYTVSENTVPDGYSVTGSPANPGGTITNKHDPATIDISATKVWDDNDDQDGKREDVTFILKAGGTAVDTGKKISKTATGDDLKVTWTELPVYAAGKKIEYTVEEAGVENGKITMNGVEYTVEVSGNATNGFTIKNSYTPAVTTVTVTKDWEDDYENVGETRPESITVTLSGTYTVDNTEKSVTIPTEKATATITPNEEGIWSYTWTGLPVNAEGEAITYAVKETTVTGYTPTIGAISGSAENGFSFAITNTYSATPVSVDPPVQKVITGTEELYNKGNFTFTIANTAKPEGVTAPMPENTTITNSANYERKDKPAFYEFGEIEFTIPGTYTYTVTESGSVPCVTNDAESTKPITFTVTQNADGQLVVTPTTDQAVFTFTNVYADVSVTVQKVWDDANNQDGKRPASITVQLKANGQAKGDPIELNEDNKWSATVEKLPVYEDGVEINYTWEEDKPAGYSLSTKTEETVTTLTNSYTPGKTSVNGTKTWNDENNQDGKRPASITVNLLADGEVIKTVTVGEAEKWQWEFIGLPEYSNGKKITYTVEEAGVENGKITMNGAEYTVTVDGYNITNTHAPEKINVTVTKTWSDYDNQYNTRPQSITVQLYANGKVCGDPVTIKADNAGQDGKWTYTYTGLDKYEAGEEIVYTVTEEAVSGYTTTVNGLDITNSYVRNNPSRPPKDPVEEPDEPIEDPDTPLAPIEEDPEEEIPADDTPFAPYEEEPDESIDEEPTPFSPYTGDDRHTAAWGFVSLMSLAGIVVVARKRREE